MNQKDIERRTGYNGFTYIIAQTLPEAWEEAVLDCWENGTPIKTEYDKEEDLPSRDCTATIVVTNPLQEPRIHRAFPGGLDDLKKYELEVTDGVHDHWIKPEEGKWSYTYHDRLFNYQQIEPGHAFDQIAWIVEKLCESPHTRRAQAIIWNPAIDTPNPHCPCAQRFWFRIFDNRLNLNMHIRSNDAFKAGFMNMWSFIALQEIVAKKVSEKLGKEIGIGPYCHIADSFHIYGSYFNEFKGFLKTIRDRSFEERTWRSDDPVVQDMFAQAVVDLEKEEK